MLGPVRELAGQLDDFSAVTISQERDSIVIEADPWVTLHPLTKASGEEAGTMRVAIPTRGGFILRVEYRATANNVGHAAEEDRVDSIESSTKIILSQASNEASTDVRAEALFVDYLHGKDLPRPWRERLDKMLAKLEALDVRARP